MQCLRMHDPTMNPTSGIYYNRECPRYTPDHRTLGYALCMPHVLEGYHQWRQHAMAYLAIRAASKAHCVAIHDIETMSQDVVATMATANRLYDIYLFITHMEEQQLVRYRIGNENMTPREYEQHMYGGRTLWEYYDYHHYKSATDCRALTTLLVERMITIQNRLEQGRSAANAGPKAAGTPTTPPDAFTQPALMGLARSPPTSASIQPPNQTEVDRDQGPSAAQRAATPPGTASSPGNNATTNSAPGGQNNTPQPGTWAAVRQHTHYPSCNWTSTTRGWHGAHSKRTMHRKTRSRAWRSQ